MTDPLDGFELRTIEMSDEGDRIHRVPAWCSGELGAYQAHFVSPPPPSAWLIACLPLGAGFPAHWLCFTRIEDAVAAIHDLARLRNSWATLETWPLELKAQVIRIGLRHNRHDLPKQSVGRVNNPVPRYNGARPEDYK